MPANYSVIAENELSYVEGGASFIDWIGDRTATVWGAANVKQFNTNIVTLVGNAFVTSTVQNSLGKIFEAGASLESVGNGFKSLFVAKNGHIGESIARTLGTAAAVYNLGNVSVANTAASVTLFPGAEKGWKESEKTVTGGVETVKYIWG